MAKHVRYTITMERGEVLRLLKLLLDDALNLEASMRAEGAKPSEIAMTLADEQPLFDKLADAIKFPVQFHESLRLHREAREAIQISSPGPGSTKPDPET